MRKIKKIKYKGEKMKELKIRGKEEQGIMAEMKKETFFPTDKGNSLTFEEFKSFLERNGDKVKKIRIKAENLDKEMLAAASLAENFEYLVQKKQKMLKVSREKSEMAIVLWNGNEGTSDVLAFSNFESLEPENDIFYRRDETGFGYADLKKRERLMKFKGLMKFLELPSHEFETDIRTDAEWIVIDKKIKGSGDFFRKFSTDGITVNTSHVNGTDCIDEIFFSSLEEPYVPLPCHINYVCDNELVIGGPFDSIEFCKNFKTADLFAGGKCYEFQNGEISEFEGAKISAADAEKLLKLFKNAENYLSLEDFANVKRTLEKVIRNDNFSQKLKLIEELEF